MAGLVRDLFIFCFEREILLGQVTEGDHDHCREYLRDGGIDVELLYEQLDEDIVEPQADHHQDEVSEQLHPAMEDGLGEYDILVEKIARGEADGEGHNKGKNIGGNGNKTHIDIPFMQDKIITDSIHDDIQYGVGTPADGITKGLKRHELAERRVEKINKIYDPLFHHICTPIYPPGY
jgi:hypothetical protein